MICCSLKTISQRDIHKFKLQVEKICATANITNQNLTKHCFHITRSDNLTHFHLKTKRKIIPAAEPLPAAGIIYLLGH